MSSLQESLNATYCELSSLYKNPTRTLGGMAATDVDELLVVKHAELLAQFNGIDWDAPREKPVLYFKALALLYEIDDYRGRAPTVERRILNEPEISIDVFRRLTQNDDNNRQEVGFSDDNLRSLWKAKVLCCVAAIESRRKSSDSNVLLNDLNILEKFVHDRLHRTKGHAAWTTLAFVYTAQARVCRHAANHKYVRDKLLEVIDCLNERTTEIIKNLTKETKKFSDVRQHGLDATDVEGKIRDLEDDLVFIKQKETLVVFNLGLDNMLRGFLATANQACQAAKLQFRLHGQAYHRLSNKLLMIAIKRGRTSTDDENAFELLETELEEILHRLKPNGVSGNPKLYLYGLREMAVIRHLLGKFPAMRSTLRRMERVKPLSLQLKSRIDLLHSRALYGSWRAAPGELQDKDRGQLVAALKHSEAAFAHATGGKGTIRSHDNVRSLLASIKSFGSRNVIDTMESLITYGTVQLFLKQYFDAVGETANSAESTQEAIKSGKTVIELSEDDNPRLLAMGHLVLADAYRLSNFIVEARQHLETAKTLEARIQHEYVKDRRKAIELKIPSTLTLDLAHCGHVDHAQDMVLGWYIANCEDKSKISRIAKQLQISRNRVRSYIERQGKSSPYYHLLTPGSSKMKQKRGT